MEWRDGPRHHFQTECMYVSGTDSGCHTQKYVGHVVKCVEAKTGDERAKVQMLSDPLASCAPSTLCASVAGIETALGGSQSGVGVGATIFRDSGPRVRYRSVGPVRLVD